MSKLRVLLADDHAVVREGLKTLVNAQPDMEVVAEAGDGPGAVELCQQHDPDGAVVDISMPGLNGAEVTARLKRERPDRKVLALTVHEDRGDLWLMLEAGAAGYVLKRAAAAELIQAVRAVAAGGTYLDPSLAGSVVGSYVRTANGETPGGAELSDREAEVVRAIARGYSNKEIAGRLGLSVKTVETYKTRSLEKLGLRSRVDIVRYAVARGWLADG
jgi:DNA-binding NarL/FixJ family response regulator